jgi:hypothetical protein
MIEVTQRSYYPADRAFQELALRQYCSRFRPAIFGKREAFLLHYGRAFVGSNHVKKFKRQKQGGCFRNALICALEHKGDYVEGCAICGSNDDIFDHHASITRKGEDATEVTWRGDASLNPYFGAERLIGSIRRECWRSKPPSVHSR